MITRVHHVAVAVRDLEAALGFWRDALGLPVVHAAEVPEQRVRAALLACGPTEIELVTPTTPDGGVARFLERRGEALHHVCLESDDVERELRRLLATGVDVLDAKPRPGLAGQVAFLHPRACAGLLVELATPSGPRTLPPSPLAVVAVHAKVPDVAAAGQLLQDLFAVARGLSAPDGRFLHLTLGDVTLQLTPLTADMTRPALTALRLRTGDLAGVAQRLEAAGVAGQTTPLGLAVGPGVPGRVPLIIQDR